MTDDEPAIREYRRLCWCCLRCCRRAKGIGSDWEHVNLEADGAVWSDGDGDDNDAGAEPVRLRMHPGDDRRDERLERRLLVYIQCLDAKLFGVPLTRAQLYPLTMAFGKLVLDQPPYDRAADGLVVYLARCTSYTAQHVQDRTNWVYLQHAMGDKHCISMVQLVPGDDEERFPDDVTAERAFHALLAGSGKGR